jgi:hypothetical protein
LILAAGGEVLQDMTTTAATSSSNSEEVSKHAQFLVFGELDDVKEWILDHVQNRAGDKVREMFQLMRSNGAQLVTCKVSHCCSFEIRSF